MPGEPPRRVLDPGRVAAVHATGLIDTDAEEPFDRLARLAATVLRARRLRHPPRRPALLLEGGRGGRVRFLDSAGVRLVSELGARVPVSGAGVRLVVAADSEPARAVALAGLDGAAGLRVGERPAP